jgi:hypothetical protein
MRCGTGVNGASPKVNARITSKEKGSLSSQCIFAFSLSSQGLIIGFQR